MAFRRMSNNQSFPLFACDVQAEELQDELNQLKSNQDPNRDAISCFRKSSLRFARQPSIFVLSSKWHKMIIGF